MYKRLKRQQRPPSTSSSSSHQLPPPALPPPSPCSSDTTDNWSDEQDFQQQLEELQNSIRLPSLRIKQQLDEHAGQLDPLEHIEMQWWRDRNHNGSSTATTGAAAKRRAKRREAEQKRGYICGTASGSTNTPTWSQRKGRMNRDNRQKRLDKL